ncbi:receptor-type tyrosine-protein phosphatase C-like protein [Lates japonicus]|uniref:Receptor-type tyrosine-protein phosphatase C-like protein n=1 Tax=Lates japonicus TaxID=270547 RepID=A0AAD3M9Q7_LATJO|nr:receptor-type tyrosine-protein phosphatase C-like protein [Lates japonicus]
MKLNSSPCGVHYRERTSAHPHRSPAKRDLEDPRGMGRISYMAGLCNVRILLLWVGIISLVNSYSYKAYTIMTGSYRYWIPYYLTTTSQPNYMFWTREHGRVNESKKLSELEPFTDYNCTGQIKDNDGTVIKTTTSVHVYINNDNNKAVIGFLVFSIFLIISVVVAVVVYKLYIKKRRVSRNGVNEGVMLESTAIYMNVPPREWHHKETC